MALFWTGSTQTGSGGDDFMLGHPADGAVHTIEGGLGDDVIYGDFDHFIANAGTSTANAPSLTASDLPWSTIENEDVANATSVPHTSTYCAPAAGTTAWYAVTVAAGATITLDVDYGVHHAGGTSDTALRILAADGTTTLAENSQSATSNGGFGSDSTLDPFLSYTFATAGTYYIQIAEDPGFNTFEGGEEFILNVSLTGQPVSNNSPVAGDDRLYGDANQPSSNMHGGDDTIHGGSGSDWIYGDFGGAFDRTVFCGDDVIFAGSGTDTIFGDVAGAYNGIVHAGDDIIFAGSGSDEIYGDANGGIDSTFYAGNDTIFGGDGDDVIHGDIDYSDVFANITVTSGNDIIYGGFGNDSIYADFFLALPGGEVAQGGGNDVLDGGPGADLMRGGDGNDRYYIDDIGDQIVWELSYSRGGGIDTVHSTISYTLGNNLEVLRLEGTANINGTGNNAPESIVGNVGLNILQGKGGNDTINAKGGNDVLIGGTGRDTLVGDAGYDRFDYNAIADSYAGAANRDFINGFAHHYDTIDLSDIDANPFYSGDQAFVFIGSAAFTGSGAGSGGQLRFANYGGNYVIVEADWQGDGVADMQIFVNGTTFMNSSDFVL